MTEQPMNGGREGQSWRARSEGHKAAFLPPPSPPSLLSPPSSPFLLLKPSSTSSPYLFFLIRLSSFSSFPVFPSSSSKTTRSMLCPKDRLKIGKHCTVKKSEAQGRLHLLGNSSSFDLWVNSLFFVDKVQTPLEADNLPVLNFGSGTWAAADHPFHPSEIEDGHIVDIVDWHI